MKKTLSRLIAVLLVAGISVGAFAQVSQEQAAAEVRLQDLRATVALALTKAAEEVAAGVEFGEWADYVASAFASLSEAQSAYDEGRYEDVVKVVVPVPENIQPTPPPPAGPTFGDDQPQESEATPN